LAFQLVDDLLDFTASPEKLGKPVLSDLKEGKVTLPLIFALEATTTRAVESDGDGAGHAHLHANGDGRRLVAKVLEERDFQSVRPEQITRLVKETGALERSRKMAREYVSRAKESLSELPDTEYRRALLAVPEFILDREN
jgi:octaprenyl-diphosphate synthase